MAFPSLLVLLPMGALVRRMRIEHAERLELERVEHFEVEHVEHFDC